ncbi:hypothetical protein BJV74DRAFT_308331 [Russula compacta]|nr:hypothetical protein BJV74DRAFT_308331 [Russula compacta]
MADNSPCPLGYPSKENIVAAMGVYWFTMLKPTTPCFPTTQAEPDPNTPGLIDFLVTYGTTSAVCRLTATFDSCHSGTLLGSSFTDAREARA